MSTKTMLFSWLLAGLMYFVRYGTAAVPYSPSPFTLTGTIDGMTLRNASLLAGGTITVDGMTVIVPDNLLVTLPSISVAWSELFDENGSPKLPGPASWQTTVYGNRVLDNRIAGLIYITQQENRLLQGFIESIGPDGHFTVNGRDCVLNDPIGRFGPNYTAHPLWTVDADNPSVRTKTGFPVCIPRSENDEECPSKNRPLDVLGLPVQIYTFKDPATLTETDPDPRKMMPLAVGDYVTFNGINLGETLAVYDLLVNLGIYTAPGTQPAYVTVEAAQWAVYQNDPDGEDAETRADTFTTDPTSVVEFFALDVDPCTGAVTERSLMLTAAQSGAPKGRARFRGSKSNFNPVTREIGFRLTSGTSQGPLGIKAGEFIQPVMVYIFTELQVFGRPEIALDFSLLPYLAQGSGPYESGDYLANPIDTSEVVGQLVPWPGANAPRPATCLTPTPTPTPTETETATATATPGEDSQTPSPTTTTVSPGPSPDAIAILTGTIDSGQGMRHIVVEASTNNLNAKLSCALTGDDPVSAVPMTSQGNGQWSLALDIKGKVDTAIVTSDFGGRATITLVRP